MVEQQIDVQRCNRLLLQSLALTLIKHTWAWQSESSRLGMHDISATISVSADKCPFFLLSLSARYENLADIFKPINNALFPSETLQMCAVHYDGFEMLEIWLESLWKGQYTYVQHVQSKSVIKATYNYNKNITVNDVVESLCAVDCACVECVHNGATSPWQLSSLVHLQSFV